MSIFVVLLGLIFGSFMNVLVYRIPKGLSIVRPKSSCPNCSSYIKFYDNIPVLSYILLKGKCRNCNEKISIMYPLIEITTAITFFLVFLKFSISIDFVVYSIFAFLLLSASFTDIRTLISKDYDTGVIPDIYAFLGIIIGLLYAFYEGKFTTSLAGFGAGFLVLYIPAMIYRYIRKRDGIGEGDFILLAMIGVFLGHTSIPYILTISALLGVIIGVCVIIYTKDSKFPLPFAPMLSAGGMIYLFTDNMLKNSF